MKCKRFIARFLVSIFFISLFTPSVLASETESLTKNTNDQRIAGASRYHTAVEISQYGWKDNSADTIIIARGDSFPDALAGTPLAYALNAPILLTDSKLAANTINEIDRLGAKQAIILGGESAVSQQVADKLKSLGLNVKRIAGSGRYETARAIADEVNKHAVTNTDKVILAYGLDFPDALAIAPYAAQNGYPILLTETNQLPGATKAFLNQATNVEEIIIVGGEKVVNEKLAKQLENKYKVTRKSGSGRYETAAEIMKIYDNPSKAFIANGKSFADALTGSVLAAKEGAPLLLVEKDNVPKATRNMLDRYDIGMVTVLGGPNVISEKVANQLFDRVPTLKLGETYSDANIEVTVHGLEYLSGYSDKEGFDEGFNIFFEVHNKSEKPMESNGAFNFKLEETMYEEEVNRLGYAHYFDEYGYIYPGEMRNGYYSYSFSKDITIKEIHYYTHVSGYKEDLIAKWKID